MLRATIHASWGQVTVFSDPACVPEPFRLEVKAKVGSEISETTTSLSDDQVRYLRALCDAHLSTRGER